jgi:sugar-specific transcriptional regulator TrmB
MQIEQNAHDTLEELGFSDKGASVYIALLKLGQGSVSHIAKEAHTSRTVVYPIIEKLQQDGYVTEIIGRNTKTYQINDPALLISKMKAASNNLDFVLSYLKDTVSKQVHKPKVAIYDTDHSILTLYEHLNMQDNVLVLTSYARQATRFQKELAQWESAIKHGIYPMNGWKFLVSNDSGVDTAQLLATHGHNVRIVQFPKENTADISIHDDTLMITVLEDQPFVVTIESKYLADSLRMMYEILWENGEELVA